MKEFESKTILTDEIKIDHNGKVYAISTYTIETPIGKIYVVYGTNSDMSLNELYCGTKEHTAILAWKDAKTTLFKMFVGKE